MTLPGSDLANQKKFHTSITEFVGPTVLTIPITNKIISEIMPFFPKNSKVIAGYLSEEQLYWKINYHWDVLKEAIHHCLSLKIDTSYIKILKQLLESLESNSPDPASGYRKSTMPGEPKDKSSHETILERHKIVSQCKRDFKKLVEDAKIFEKTKRDPKALMLAYAPVASPKKGKHSTGYALDISGDNLDISRIVKSLGGTAFNEGSHVHCEWKNGVDQTKQGGLDGKDAAKRKAQMTIDSKVTNIKHSSIGVV